MKESDLKKIKTVPHPIIYGMYVKLIETTKHYALLRIQYTQLAFTFLMATFLGTEIILSGAKNYPGSRLVILLFMFSTGTLGIILLWTLDFISAERYIQSANLELIKLEKKFSWLPKVHISKTALFHKGTAQLKSYIYVVFCLVLLVFSAFNAYFILKDYQSDLLKYLISLFFALVLLFILYLSLGSRRVNIFPTLVKKFSNLKDNYK